MRILALDVGDKRIGVAVSDELMFTAQGLGVISRCGLKKDINEIASFVKEYDVRLVVIGLPLNMNGSAGPRAEMVKDFGQALSNEIGIEVKYWDERLSTVAAQKSLIAADVSRAKRKKVIDKIAAVYILQGYLDSVSCQ